MAAEKGKHVICEKPLEITKAEIFSLKLVKMKFGEKIELDRNSLAKSIKSMCISAGDTVLVHSPLKGIAKFTGGVEDIVKAF